MGSNGTMCPQITHIDENLVSLALQEPMIAHDHTLSTVTTNSEFASLVPHIARSVVYTAIRIAVSPCHPVIADLGLPGGTFQSHKPPEQYCAFPRLPEVKNVVLNETLVCFVFRVVYGVAG